MARPLPARAAIVGCLSDAGRPMHSRELSEKLGVPESSYSRLAELLEQLCFDGSLQRMGGHRFRTREPDTRHREGWEGMLTVNPRGFGFVAAAGHDDVFIPPDAIGSALHGDKVRISVVRQSSRGYEGHIDSIVTRRSNRIIGTLRKRGRQIWLEPDDTRLRGPVLLEPAGKAASDDAGATLKGSDGDAALVELSRFPESADETLEGRLIAVLGTPGDPKVEVRKILMREQIVEEHPPEAMQEAETMSAKLRVLPLEGRRDLRHIPLPTIDPKDARDHDDSVWVEKLDNGYRAYVAIADVSEYVVDGSALDAEARARGCTLYLPDRAVPMLPSALAADLCSLLPDRERFCLCVIVDLDKQGQVESFEIVEGLMRSCAMLTYEGVAAALGFTEDGPRSIQAEAMRPGLKQLDELSRKLRKVRIARGALELELPEAHVLLNEETGEPEDVVRRATDPGVRRAYQMIEELMLLANELVAQWLSGKKSLAIYRVHSTPDPAKLERLASVAHRLGLEIDPEELTEPKALGRWLRKIADHPRKTALEMLTLRSLKQAAYDIVNVGHFGLASDSYLHFTSPIRRYPDLIVHRLVKGILRGGRPKNAPEEVESLRNAATLSSQRERASVEVEREVVDLYRARLMQGSVGQTFEGMVTGFSGTGAYVALDNPYVDVLVRFEQLGAEEYELSEDTLAVVGKRSGDRVELGQRMTVVIEEASLLRRVTLARRVTSGKARTSSAKHQRPERSLAGVSKSKPGHGRPSPKGPRPSPKGARPSPKDARPSPKGARPGPKDARPTKGEARSFAGKSKTRKARAK